MHSTVGTLTKCYWGLRNAIPPKFFLAPSQFFLLIAWGCLGPSPRSGPSLTTTGCWVPEGVLLGVSGLGAVRD